MGINFPSSPAEGQVFNASPGVSFVARSGLWRPAPLKTALPRNYLINPSMQASQENVNAAGTGSVYYMADQWYFQKGAGITGTAAARQPGPSPNNSNLIQVNVTTAIPTLGGTDVMEFLQPLEGQRVADFQWGTANAKAAVARFWCLTNVPGQYSFALASSPITRTFIATFNLAMTAWTQVTIPIPGDTVGPWVFDTTRGMLFRFCMASGSSNLGIAGWQDGNKLGAAGQTNGAAAVNNLFYFSDAGLYLDPYKTGVAPPFVVPEPTQELRRCQRYWYRAYGWGGVVTAATTGARGGMRHPVPMRTTPVGSIKGAPKLYDGGGTPTITALSSACNPYAAEFDITAAAGGLTGGRPAQMFYQGDDQYIAMSARM